MQKLVIRLIIRYVYTTGNPEIFNPRTNTLVFYKALKQGLINQSSSKTYLGSVINPRKSFSNFSNNFLSLKTKTMFNPQQIEYLPVVYVYL